MKTYEEFMKQFDEEIANTTKGVAGAGDNPDQTVIVRKNMTARRNAKMLRQYSKEYFQINFN